MNDEPSEPLIEVLGPEDIPEFATEEEEHHFWSTHAIGPAFAARTGTYNKDEWPLLVPRPRSDVDAPHGS